MDRQFILLILFVIIMGVLRLVMSIHESRNNADEGSVDYRKFINSRPKLQGYWTRTWRYFTGVYLKQPSKDKSSKWHTLEELQNNKDWPKNNKKG